MKGYKNPYIVGIEFINKAFEKQGHQIHMKFGSFPKLFIRLNIIFKRWYNTCSKLSLDLFGNDMVWTLYDNTLLLHA